MTSVAKRLRLAGALVFGWLAVVVMTLAMPSSRVAAAEPEPAPQPTGIPTPVTPLTHAQVHADWPPLSLELLAGEEGEGAGSAESPQATDSLCDLYTGQRVAYQKYTRAGRWDIYLRQCYQPLDPFIVSTSGYELMPDLNDGATRLLFVRATQKENSEEIYVTETSRQGATRLTQNNRIDTQPAWIPLTEDFVFASDRNGNADIFRASSQGGEPVALVASPLHEMFPDVSLDGNYLTWVSAQGAARELWMMGVNGANPHRVAGPFALLAYPAWNASGSAIVFSADMDGDGWSDLGRVNLETGRVALEVRGSADGEYLMGDVLRDNDTIYVASRLKYRFYDGEWELIDLQAVFLQPGPGEPSIDTNMILPLTMHPSLSSFLSPKPPVIGLRANSIFYLSMTRSVQSFLQVYDPDFGAVSCSLEYRRAGETGAWRPLFGGECSEANVPDYAAQGLVGGDRIQLRANATDLAYHSVPWRELCVAEGCVPVEQEQVIQLFDATGKPARSFPLQAPGSVESFVRTDAGGKAMVHRLLATEPLAVFDVAPAHSTFDVMVPYGRISVLGPLSATISTAEEQYNFVNWDKSTDGVAFYQAYINRNRTRLFTSDRNPSHHMFGALARSFTLPAEWARPYFSIGYDYALHQGAPAVPDARNYAVITITVTSDGVAPLQLTRRWSGASIQRSGVDLARFAGKTIRVVIDGEAPTLAALSFWHAMLANWQPPTVTDVSTGTIHSEQSVIVTLTGTHFTEGVVVVWNGAPLPVTRVNDEQVEVGLPAALPYGPVVLDIYADGAYGTTGGMVWKGDRSLYLPVVVRRGRTNAPPAPVYDITWPGW